MFLHYKKLLIACCLLLVTGLPAKAKTKGRMPKAVAAALQALQSNKLGRHASLGLYAVNLTKGQVVVDYDGSRSMVPASTLKVLTTAAALELLGPSFCFKTTIQHDGALDAQGTLQGNVYIKGGGDPALGSRQFSAHYYAPHFVGTWVQAIQAAGIKKITGAVVGDAQCYAPQTPPASWTWEDVGQHYGAGSSGLSIFDNQYSLQLASGSQAGARTQLKGVRPALPGNITFKNEVTGEAITNDQAYIYGGPHTYTKLVQGAIPKGQPCFVVKGAMHNPAHWAAYTLAKALEAQGIAVAQGPAVMDKRRKTVRKSLHTTCSPQLCEILRVTNQESINLYAEHLLCHLALVCYGEGSTKKGMRALKNFWKKQGMDTSGMLLHDGSGLSRYNALTAKQLVGALQHMSKSANFAVFYASLPVAGRTGNLAGFFKGTPLENNLRAKSGTLQHVRGLAGYCTQGNGDKLAFALLLNHYDGLRSRAEAALEKILLALVQ